ncbi:lysoplasmalogenase [Streptosporangium sp. OZ121]|uniref:lysoplasmalogenase n=1 Tax=Streptosporangium sp. OZ121 TaxID=3444183 RepID=UPI003F7A4A94
MTRLLIAFAACAVLHLLAPAAGPTAVEWVTKGLLMPLLAAWVAARHGPPPVVAGLLFSGAGDVALQFDAGAGVFVLGMGLFAVAHACYVTYFVRGGALPELRRRPHVPAAYAVVWVILITVLWPGLGALRIPVAVYSLILTATAVTALGYGPRAGLGGALFLLSDALIAFRLAGVEVPHSGIWVMLSYIAAQFLIASGASRPRTAPTP